MVRPDRTTDEAGSIVSVKFLKFSYRADGGVGVGGWRGGGHPTMKVMIGNNNNKSKAQMRVLRASRLRQCIIEN